MRPNDHVDRAARFHSTFAAPGLMRNTLSPLRSNELLGGVARACGYDSADAPGGGHAPIRCRNATILPR